MRNFTSFNSVNFPEHKASELHRWLQEIICSSDYDVTPGALPTKAGTYTDRAESFAFSQQLA